LFDVVIIGAGVHGAGVALAAAAAGQKTLLLEKSAPAHGTSSRSSKLIHGGLRYLETAQFRLVRESLTERALMLRNAPELVRLQPFYLPVYRRTRRRPWQLRMGLALYATLGGFRPGAAFGSIPRSQWADLDGLELHDLQAVLRYWDGQTDDAALTRAVVHAARQLGCELQVPATFDAAELEGDTVAVHYSQGSAQHSVQTRVLVNAAGPWAGEVLKRVRPAQPHRAVELVQGTHIVLPGETKQGIYYVEAPEDGRAVFVMPWYGSTLVGTTEVPYGGSPEDVRPSSSEVTYLLAIARHYFPRYRASTGNDVLQSFAGLRVLPRANTQAFNRSRETMFDVDRADKPRVLSIYGGKLTGWRATAEQVMARLAPSLPVRERRADTREIRLVPVEA
jgi:glycerol-3-phosphate dehydrogenase